MNRQINILTDRGHASAVKEALTNGTCAGLNDAVTAVDIFDFDKLTFGHTILSSAAGVVSARTVQFLTSAPKKSKQGEEPTLADDTTFTHKAVPVLPGRIHIRQVSIAMRVDNSGGVRAITDARSDEYYEIAFLDDNGRTVAKTTVNDLMLTKGRDNWNWLTELGLTARIEQSPTRYATIRNLLRAEVAARPDRGAVRRVRETGIFHGGSGLVFASPSGVTINSLEVDGSILCSPTIPMQLDHCRKYRPVVVVADQRSQALQGLTALLGVTRNPGLNFALLGDLLGAPLASVEDAARGVTGLVGESGTGKTTVAGIFQSIQSPDLDDSKIALSIDMRPKKRGGTTATGLRTVLAPLAGTLLLADDATKKGWPEARLADALMLIEEVTNLATPCHGGPVQATVSQNDGVIAADTPPARLRVVIPMEVLPIKGKLKDDSALNRMATVFYRLEDRAPQDDFERLGSLESRREANRGWSVWVQWLLEGNHTHWTEAWGKARAALRPIGNDRRIAVWAARLAPIYMFDQLLDSYQVVGARYFEAAREAFLGCAEEEEAYGTTTVEQRAATDPVEGFCAMLRLMAERAVYAIAPRQAADEAATPPVLSEEAHWAGYTYSTLGWEVCRSELSEDDQLKFRSSAGPMGEFHERKANARTQPFKFYLQLTGGEWTRLANRVREQAERNGYAVTDLSELRDSLIERGIARKTSMGKPAKHVIQINADILLENGDN